MTETPPSSPNVAHPDVSDRARLPDPLTDSYHLARRNLTLAAGVLLAWSVVGLDLVGAPKIEDAVLKVRKPELLPWVLAALVVFFLYRMVLEFLECDPERTRRTAPRVDAWGAGTLAVISLVSTQYQRLSHWVVYYWQLIGLQVVGLIAAAAAIFGVVAAFTGLLSRLRKLNLLPRFLVEIEERLEKLPVSDVTKGIAAGAAGLSAVGLLPFALLSALLPVASLLELLSRILGERREEAVLRQTIRRKREASRVAIVVDGELLLTQEGDVARPVQLRDIAVDGSGVGIVTHHPVRVGSSVTLDVRGMRVGAHVVWTRENLAGLRLSPEAGNALKAKILGPVAA